MAASIGCSYSFPRPRAGRSPPPDHVSGKSRGSGNLQLLLFEFGKFVPSSGDLLLSRVHPITHLHSLVSKKLKIDKKFKASKRIIRMPLDRLRFSDKLSAFEVCWLQIWRGTPELKFQVMALAFTNAVMMAAPLEALAETCEPESSFFNMPLLLLVAMIGATVGGLLARQRRGELQRLNEQLRQINSALRRQAKIESYAPSLSYAPVGARIAEGEVIVDARKQELISKLKTGKNFLRNQEPEKAFAEFKPALELAQNLQDPIKEKKAARGLGASLQRQGKYREAIQYHSMVLEISEREGEDSGITEAYGAIADCYTELGDLERAGRYYDRYISQLERD